MTATKNQQNPANSQPKISMVEYLRLSNTMRRALQACGIRVKNIKPVIGESSTLYKVYPEPNFVSWSFEQRKADIARELGAESVTIVSKKGYIEIEVNDKKEEEQ